MKSNNDFHVWIEEDFNPNQFMVFIKAPGRQSSVFVKKVGDDVLLSTSDTILSPGQNPITWKGRPISLTESENLKAWKSAAELQAENLKKLTQFLDNHLNNINNGARTI